MNATIERISGKLSLRYLLYIEKLIVDLWSESGEVELRCGFALRSDHILRSVTFKVPATAATSEADLEVIIGAIFKQLEMLIDLAITEQDLPH